MGREWRTGVIGSGDRVWGEEVGSRVLDQFMEGMGGDASEEGSYGRG